MNTAKQKKGGYSLIELLVVIAIIGLLAVGLFAVLGESKKDSRDAKRLEDIRYIQTQLERYYNHNGRYPPSGGAALSGSWSHSNDGSWDTLIANVGADLPQDPSSNYGFPTVSGGNYSYAYFASSLTTYCARDAYLLVFNLEGRNQNGGTVELCNGGSAYDYGDAFVVGVDKDGSVVTP